MLTTRTRLTILSTRASIALVVFLALFVLLSMRPQHGARAEVSGSKTNANKKNSSVVQRMFPVSSPLAVEDIAGSYAGLAVGTASNCNDPADNGPIFTSVNVRLNQPTVDNFGVRRVTGTVTVGGAAPGDQDLILDLSAVLSDPADNRNLTNGVFNTRYPSLLTGSGTFSGQWNRATNGNPDHLGLNFSGSGGGFGSNCSITGSLSADRVGAPPVSTFSPGVVSRPVADPQVVATQQNGQFQIAPRSSVTGDHYNGFISDQAVDLASYTVSVEAKQTAAGGAQTVFALANDSNNFYRFVKVDGIPNPNLANPGSEANSTTAAPLDSNVYLVFEVKINGVLSSFNILYDPVQHRFWRFRNDPVSNTINFETSPDRITWTVQKSVSLNQTISNLTVELSAGSSTAVASPGTASFGSLHKGDIYEVLAEYDGDLRNDISIFRPSNGIWYLLKSSASYNPGQFQAFGWGVSGDIPVPGDYDGDGRVDLAIFRPSNGVWYILKSSTGYDPAQYQALGWGVTGDIPAPADYDGDGRTDIAIFRPSNGVWYILKSSTNYNPAQYQGLGWGSNGDVPVPRDYDGDGKSDIAIFRPSNGVWYILRSSTNYNPAQYQAFGWGVNTDVPVPRDYDGDGRTDIAIFRPSNGVWYILKSSTGYNAAQFQGVGWGTNGDIPEPGDYDGDGKTDIAIFRPSNGVWYILKSSTNYNPAQFVGVGWGIASDVPVAIGVIR